MLAEASGLTPTQLALAWVQSRWFTACTIIGATSLEQLKVPPPPHPLFCRFPRHIPASRLASPFQHLMLKVFVAATPWCTMWFVPIPFHPDCRIYLVVLPDAARKCPPVVGLLQFSLVRFRSPVTGVVVRVQQNVDAFEVDLDADLVKVPCSSPIANCSLSHLSDACFRIPQIPCCLHSRCFVAMLGDSGSAKLPRVCGSCSHQDSCTVLPTSLRTMRHQPLDVSARAWAAARTRARGRGMPHAVAQMRRMSLSPELHTVHVERWNASHALTHNPCVRAGGEPDSQAAEGPCRSGGVIFHQTAVQTAHPSDTTYAILRCDRSQWPQIAANSELQFYWPIFGMHDE